MWLVGSSAAPFSLEAKKRIARSTEMRAMPELFAVLTAASTHRGGVFSCCRIRERPCRTASTKKLAKRHSNFGRRPDEFLLQGIRYRVDCARGISRSIVAILQVSTGKLFSTYAELSDLQKTSTE